MALGSLASSKYSQHQEYRLLEKCFLSFPLIVSSFAETPINMKGIWNKGVIFSPGRSMEKKERQRKKPNEEYISFPLAICHISKVNVLQGASWRKRWVKSWRRPYHKANDQRSMFDFLPSIPTFYTSFFVWKTSLNVQTVLLLAGH